MCFIEVISNNSCKEIIAHIMCYYNINETALIIMKYPHKYEVILHWK